MTEISGDIWVLSDFYWDEICIPTNTGWTKAGRNPMGKGLAGAAQRRFPGIDEWYGNVCMEHKGNPPIVRERFRGASGARVLVFVPTKPFRPELPHMSWQGKATLEVIEQSLIALAQLSPLKDQGKIYVPLLGCGQGGLHRDDVRKLMDKHLTAPHFLRVRWKH